MCIQMTQPRNKFRVLILHHTGGGIFYTAANHSQLQYKKRCLCALKMSALVGPALKVSWDVDGEHTKLDANQLDQLSDAMTCCICMEEYSEAHMPMCLVPCGHTACATCISQLQAARCPVCRETIENAVFNHSVKVLAKLLRADAVPATASPMTAPSRSPQQPPSLGRTRVTRAAQSRAAATPRSASSQTRSRNLERLFADAAETSPVRDLSSAFNAASI